jgi:hypothetical protein
VGCSLCILEREYQCIQMVTTLADISSFNFIERVASESTQSIFLKKNYTVIGTFIDRPFIIKRQLAS